MSTPRIVWRKSTEKPQLGDPGATLAVGRDAWEALGARFANADDGQGETPLLAAAEVITPAGPIKVGILDYGDPTTYLLVAGNDAERADRTTAVLETLADCGAISSDDDVVDLAASAPVSLEERVVEFERHLEQLSQQGAEEDDQVKKRLRQRKGQSNKIRIRLKAYDTSAIESAAREIVEVATRTGAAVSGPVPLPIEKNVYCVIRSPYKADDAREHFEIRTHKRLIDIHLPSEKQAWGLGKSDTVIEISDIAMKPRLRSPR